MGVLCDTQIRELIGIEPFEENTKRAGKISYGVSSYGYDLRGNRTSVIDPVNGTAHPTLFSYDLRNRLTGIVYPDGHPWSVNDVKALLGDKGFSNAPLFAVEYFKDADFSDLAKTSVTPFIDFDLGMERGTGSPDAGRSRPRPRPRCSCRTQSRSLVTDHSLPSATDRVLPLYA